MDITLDFLILQIGFSIVEVDDTLVAVHESGDIKIFTFLDIDSTVVGHAACKGADLAIHAEGTVIGDGSVVSSAICPE